MEASVRGNSTVIGRRATGRGGRRGGGLQRLRCGISIQGRIRERLFYKDGQIELRRRFHLVRGGEGRF